MGNLAVFEINANGEKAFVIAEGREEASEELSAHLGLEEGFGPESAIELPMRHRLELLDPEADDETVKGMTCAEWIARQGKGLLGSTYSWV